MAVEYDGTSRERRPDAVSLDYLTAFQLGPDELNNVDLGLAVRAWRCRLVGNEVRVARALETSWDEEEVVVTLVDGSLVRELDFAFDQNGDPLVGLELTDNHIWLYWFDPVEGESVLADLGPGRNPRLVLDDIVDVTNSDVQVFFVSDALDCIAHRQQRDRWEIVYATPVEDVENVYLQKVFKGTAKRLNVLYVVRNQEAGTYSFDRLSSMLYPFYAEPEDVEQSGRVVSGLLYLAIIDYPATDEEVLNTGRVESGSLAFALEEFAAEGEFEHFLGVEEVTMEDVLITATADDESQGQSGRVLSGLLDNVTIFAFTEDESQQLSASVVSGSLVVA